MMYWPVVISIIATFGVVHSIKGYYRNRTEGQRRFYTRIASFNAGFLLTYVALQCFSELTLQRQLYLSLFVALFNPSIYWALMIYLRIKRPGIHEKLSCILKKHKAGQ